MMAPMWERMYPYQRDDVAFCMWSRRCIIGHPCSGRKTLSGLAAAFEMATRSGLVLVAGPAMSRSVWHDEFRKWMPDLAGNFVNIRGSFAKYAKSFDSVAQTWAHRSRNGNDTELPIVVFVGYETLSGWGAWLGQFKWDVIVMDEFHELRGRQSGRVVDGIRKVFLKNARSARVGLTATPVWSRIDGLWTLLDLIRPGVFGTQGQFMREYMGAVFDPVYQRTVKGVLTNADELRVRLEPLLRAVPPEQLPEVTRQMIAVSHPAAAKRLAAAVLHASKGGVVDDQAMRRVLSAATQRETEVKLKTLWDYVGVHAHQRLLVATQTKSAVNTVKMTAPQGVKVFTFTGDEPLQRRLDLIREASLAPAPVVVCCTMQSIRQSVDASALDGAVVLEMPWGAEEAIQFEGRFRRVSRVSAAPVDLAYIVLDDSFDRRCVELLLQKLDERGQVVGMTDADQKIRDTFGVEDVDRALRDMLQRLQIDP